MRLRLGEIFAGAAALWRGGPQQLVTVAAIFFFLPQFASLLFIGPLKVAEGLEGIELARAMLAFFQANILWFGAQFIFESMGVGTLLLMLLDPARPSVGEAMAGMARRLPGLMVARFIAALAITLGWMALFVPGLYLLGRTFLTSAVYVLERERGPAGAAIAAFERTAGNGWMLFVVAFSAWGLSNFVGGTVMQAALAAEPVGEWLSGPLKAAAAAALAAAMLLAVLLEAAAYRALPVPKTGT